MLRKDTKIHINSPTIYRGDKKLKKQIGLQPHSYRVETPFFLGILLPRTKVRGYLNSNKELKNMMRITSVNY